MNKETSRKGNEAKKPILLFECKEYKLEKIPHNIRITIKKSMAPKNPNAGIDRDWYVPVDHGIEKAKDMAKYAIDCHWKASLGRTFANQFKRKGTN